MNRMGFSFVLKNNIFLPRNESHLNTDGSFSLVFKATISYYCHGDKIREKTCRIIVVQNIIYKKYKSF